jgi:hypothetical protein
MIERETWRAMNRKLEYAGREIAKLYLNLLGIGILIGFPALCFVGLIFAVAEIGDLIGFRGSLAVIAFFGVPFFALLFCSIYANQHIWPAIKRLLADLEQSRHDLN